MIHRPITCAIDDCEKLHRPRGQLCSMHEARIRRHGDPNYRSTLSFDTPLEERLRLCSRVVESGCWEWQMSGHMGYGTIQIGGPQKAQKAHRVSYEVFIGPIPEGLVIDHLCRNPICINPDHLEPVTLAENSLRGNAPNIILHRLNQCREGHELTEENTLRATGTGRRQCRECRNKGKREAYRKSREASK